MLVVIAIMCSGIVLGYLLRNSLSTRFLPRLITLAVFLLLFLLGSEVGANQTIIDNLATLGVEALVITLGALVGSIFMAWLIWKKFFEQQKL